MQELLIEYHAMALVLILVLAIFMIIIKQNYLIKKEYKKNLIFAGIITIVVIICELMMYYFEARCLAHKAGAQVFAVLKYSLAPMIIAILGGVFKDDNKLAKRLRLLLLPIPVNALLSALSPFYGLIFVSQPLNIHIQGKLFLFYVASCMLGGIYMLVNVLVSSRRYNDKSRFMLFFVMILLLVGFVIEMAKPLVHISWITATFSIAFIYSYFCELNEKIDSVTGLFNRKAYDYRISTLKPHFSSAIIMMDIDQFKLVNDKYGHLYGDECLKELANIIQENFSFIGPCYRIGGDEFGCIARNVVGDEIVEAISEFNNSVSKIRSIDSRLPMVSIGYSLYTKKDESVYSAVERADKQMYFYKDKRKK